jgi:hypothetical protein
MSRRWIDEIAGEEENVGVEKVSMRGKSFAAQGRPAGNFVRGELRI